MEIIFNANTYDYDNEIQDIHIEIFKQSIFSIYNLSKENMDLSLLNLIIVPEEYKKELFEFQRNNGNSEFVTENDYGQGFAQVVSSKADSGEITYNVIIDKKIIFSLLLDSIIENLENEEYKALYNNTRQIAINTLCHEFAHIHENAMNRKMEWFEDIEAGIDLHLRYLGLAKICWSEYFACRTVSPTYPFNVKDCIEIINACNDVEIMLQQKRSEYNRRLITLDDFVVEFYSYTTFILKKIASAHGNLFSLEESREDIIQTMENGFGESYIKSIWSEYGQKLNKLYVDYPMWKDNTVFDDIISLIEKYYNQFDIYIKQTSKDVYYDIPVKLYLLNETLMDKGAILSPRVSFQEF